MQLGDIANYVRVSENDEILNGEGLVVAILIDHTGRKVVRIHDADKKYNIDHVAINSDDDTKQKYVEGIRAIRKYSAESNKQVQELVNKLNAEVEQMTTEVLGAPLELPKQAVIAESVEATEAA